MPVYHVPSGPQNLDGLFPTIVWSNVADYWLEILAGGTVLATTPLIKMGCCCSDEDVVIHFRNYLGTFDQAPFQKPTIVKTTKSGEWKKSLAYPLAKQDTGWNRFNVNSNDTYEAVNTCFNESDSFWLQQLFDTSVAFMQWTSVEGEGNFFLPIVILDGDFQKESSDYSASSKATVKFKLGNEYIIQRN